jgi:hypothetical protein
MHVVSHECISEHFDGKDARQIFKPTADPLAAIRIVFPRPSIASTQMVATNAAADQVEDLNISFRKNLSTINSRHKAPLKGLHQSKSSKTLFQGAWHFSENFS